MVKSPIVSLRADFLRFGHEPRISRHQGFSSPVVGDVDLLVVPEITTGNVLGKCLVYSAGAKMAGIVVGARVPIVLTSRGARSEEKYRSLVLAALADRCYDEA